MYSLTKAFIFVGLSVLLYFLPNNLHAQSATPQLDSTLYHVAVEHLIDQEKVLELNCLSDDHNQAVISYKLPSDGFVCIKLYDIYGNELSTLVNGIQKSAKYTMSIQEHVIEAGDYFCTLSLDGKSLVRQLEVKTTEDGTKVSLK